MLNGFRVTFLDDSHNHVDATCMVDVSSESEETLYDTITKSGVQVRMCEVQCNYIILCQCVHAVHCKMFWSMCFLSNV